MCTRPQSFMGTLAISLLLLAAHTTTARATWPTDPNVNLPIATLNDHFSAGIVWDGASSVILVWSDIRDTTLTDIYAQRVTVDGDTLWTMHGAPVTTAMGNQWSPRVVSDDVFGAIVVWIDNRDVTGSDVFAQRIDPWGNVMWGSSDVAICVAAESQTEVEMISDGEGGAIVVWTDYRSGLDTDIYGERIDANGNLLWGSGSGIPICVVTDDQQYPQLTSDGSGGGIFTWLSIDGKKVFTQRIDANGDSVWAANGIPVSNHVLWDIPRITTDDAGGAIITWGKGDIYAQRVDPNGNMLWQLNGAPVCTASLSQIWPAILSDGSSGAFISWSDSRDGFSLYANRVDGDGNVLWATNGVPVNTAAGVSDFSQVVSDDQGGAIVAWHDSRGGGFLYDIYAQRMDASGNMQWTTNGVAITTAPNHQALGGIVPDGHGGAIMTWEDLRLGANSPSVYAQRVDSTGGLTTPTAIPEPKPGGPSALEVLPNFPNPFGSGTLLQFRLAAASDVLLEVFDVQGRKVYSQQLGNRREGDNVHFFAGRDATGSTLPTGVYFARLSAAGHRRTLKLNLVR